MPLPTCANDDALRFVDRAGFASLVSRGPSLRPPSHASRRNCWLQLSVHGYRLAVEPYLTTRAESFGDAVVVHVSGDMDFTTSGRLCDDIMSQVVGTGPQLALDLTDVRFMDSAGISALLATRHAVLERGGSFVVRSPSSVVRRVLDVTGLSDLLIEPTRH